MVYRSFELDPDAPKDAVEPVADVLARKYGGGPDARPRDDGPGHRGAPRPRGWRSTWTRTLRGNTVDAHRLLHLALAEGGPRLQGDAQGGAAGGVLHPRGERRLDRVLRKVATDVGLDPARVDEVLASEEFLDDVRADVARGPGVRRQGSAFFVVDRKYGVSGAQPVEVLTDVLGRAWDESHPSLTVLGASDDTCGPGGCPT